tara:strand:+ start:140 stop:394 length:255 start_codon:yes stop_codon:yes gene_type:complete
MEPLIVNMPHNSYGRQLYSPAWVKPKDFNKSDSGDDIASLFLELTGKKNFDNATLSIIQKMGVEISVQLPSGTCIPWQEFVLSK